MDSGKAPFILIFVTQTAEGIILPLELRLGNGNRYQAQGLLRRSADRLEDRKNLSLSGTGESFESS